MFKKALHFPNHIFWSHWVPSKCQASKLKLRSNSILCGALAHFYDEGKAKGRSKGRPSEYDDLWCQSHSIPSKRIWKYVLFMHVAFKVASHNLCKITKCMPQQVVLTSWRLHLRFICDPKWPEQRVCRVSKNVVAFALSAIALDSEKANPSVGRVRPARFPTSAPPTLSPNPRQHKFWLIERLLVDLLKWSWVPARSNKTTEIIQSYSTLQTKWKLTTKHTHKIHKIGWLGG